MNLQRSLSLSNVLRNPLSRIFSFDYLSLSTLMFTLSGVLPNIKGYLRYKTIFCHKIALDAQLMNFLFEIKIMFRFRDI